jgi:hypothetical protein
MNTKRLIVLTAIALLVVGTIGFIGYRICPGDKSRRPTYSLTSKRMVKLMIHRSR